jgi:hypothetical protein
MEKYKYLNPAQGSFVKFSTKKRFENFTNSTLLFGAAGVL